MRKAWICILLLCSLVLGSVPASAEESAMTRVLMSCMTLGKAEEENCLRASELAQRAGFPLEFVVFAGSQSETYYQDFQKAFDESSDEVNTLIISSGAALQAWENEGLLQGDPIPLGENEPINRLALLVREDVFDAFQPVLETADDVEDFLYELQAWDPEQAPCITSSFLMDRMYWESGYTAMALFLPQEGYIPLSDGLKGLAGGLNCWLSLEDGRVWDAYNLPESREAVARYLDWVDQGLLTDYTYTQRQSLDFSGYPTLLVNTEDFMAPLLMANSPGYAALPLEEYVLCVLYPDQLPQLTVPQEGLESQTAYAWETLGGDASVFLDFLEWLRVEENYFYFMYGIEDYDYLRDQGLPLVDETNLEYTAWEQRTFFLSQKYEMGIDKPGRPGNFQQAMEAMDWTPILCMLPEDAEEARLVLSGEYGQIIAACGQAFQNTFENMVQLPGGNRAGQIELLFEKPAYQEMDLVAAYLEEILLTGELLD